MIDAYEIGIQLALQDDVSAGLQVINRGLAEVDRAIDSTSAKLIGLTNAAQAAGGTATTGPKMRPVAVSDRHADESAEQPGAQARKLSDTAGFSTPSLPSTPASKSIEPTRANLEQPISPVMASEQPKTLAISQEAPHVPPVDTPDRSQAIAPVVLEVQHSIEPMAPPSPVQSMASPEPETTKVASKQASQFHAPAVSKIRSAAPVGAGNTARQENGFTASVAQATATPKTDRGEENPSWSPVPASVPAIQRGGTATAPWTGVETRAHSPRRDAAAEQSAAPQPRTQDRSQGLTGTVMLDGHQVGYWLAEHMAKEASRPPSGTSFFDPRQTPAWTASGSI